MVVQRELTQLSLHNGGGGFLEQINNLIKAGFVKEYIPVVLSNRPKAKRTKVLKLVDPFLIFYFRYIHENLSIIDRNVEDENLFTAFVKPTFSQYLGYAFERLAEDSMPQIMKCLGLKLVDIKQMGPFFQRGPYGSGLQIDWLIIRRDAVWNLLELKNGSKVGSEVIKEVEQKISRLNIPDNITVEPVLVTGSKIASPVIKSNFFTKIITLSDLL